MAMPRATSTGPVPVSAANCSDPWTANVSTNTNCTSPTPEQGLHQSAARVQFVSTVQRASLDQATKYFACGWWQMMAVVDCSGWSWNPSLTSTPMRSAPSRSTTLALSSSLGQAG